MEKIALEIARLNETLKMIVSIAKEEIRKSEEFHKKYEEERKKMKKYKVTISTSDAYDLEIEAGSTQEAWAMADYLSSDEIKEKVMTAARWMVFQ
jgi:hypothetical protein